MLREVPNKRNCLIYCILVFHSFILYLFAITNKLQSKPLCSLFVIGIAFIFYPQRADLAMGDLTISYEREQVVDFTMPFLDLGEYSYIAKKCIAQFFLGVVSFYLTSFFALLCRAK